MLSNFRDRISLNASIRMLIAITTTETEKSTAMMIPTTTRGIAARAKRSMNATINPVANSRVVARYVPSMWPPRLLYGRSSK